MIFCLCKGVTDRQVQSALEAGSASVRDVGRCCQAGTDCGACVMELRKLIQRRQRNGGAKDAA